MKNLVMLLGFLMLVVHNLVAQIALDSMSYPETEIGTDSLKVTTASSLFPSFAPMTGGSWDMNIVTDSIPVFMGYRVPASAPYQFADSNQYNFAGFAYQGNLQSSIFSGGIFDYGRIIQKKSYNINSLTSGTNDSLIITAQNSLYSQEHFKIAFPATFNSYWSSSFHSDLHFSLTYILGGDTLAPGIIRTYTTERDSVIGYGKMSVKNASGSSSVFINVLQVRTIITHIDSFFLNGIPSSIFADIFSVTQGQKDTIYEQNFYRQSEVTPLAKVEFRDAAFTQPYKATTHIQRLLNVGVPETRVETKVNVYPNPVCGNLVYIEIPPCTGTPAYELVSMDGQKVLSGMLPANEPTAKLEIPASVAPGIYTLNLHFNGSSVYSTQLDLMK